MIRSYLKDNQVDWDENIQLLARAMRSTVNRHTGFTANMMVFGEENNMPADFMLGKAETNLAELDTVSYVRKLRETLASVHQRAREKLRTSQQRQKQDYDLRILETQYQIGDLVYLLGSSTKIGQSSKLNPIWKGPYVITKAFSPMVYQITGQKRSEVVHHDRLKPCSDRNVPLWVASLRHNILNPTSAEEAQLSEETDLPFEETLELELPIKSVVKFIVKSNIQSKVELSACQHEPEPLIKTRAGREIKKPSYLKDYD
jgi:hypothetical protein